MQRILLLVLFCLLLLVATPAEAQSPGESVAEEACSAYSDWANSEPPMLGVQSIVFSRRSSLMDVSVRIVRIKEQNREIPDSVLYHPDILSKILSLHNVSAYLTTNLESASSNTIPHLGYREGGTLTFTIGYHPSLEHEPFRLLFRSDYGPITHYSHTCSGETPLYVADCREDIGPCRFNNPAPTVCRDHWCTPATPVPALPVVGLGLLGLLTLAGGIRLTRQK